MSQFEIKIADRISAVSPSMTLAITAKAKQMKADGIDVINMAAGEPDFNTPDFIIDAANQAMREGKTKYTPANGDPQLRKTIADKLKNDNRLDYTPDQIIVGVGAKHALYNIFQAVLNPGDEILIPVPGWVSYKEMAHLAQAKPVFVETSIRDDFYLHRTALEGALSSKTRVILINSPSNPTGAVYSRKNLQEIADFAVENNLIVISDEIYEKLTYDGFEFCSIGALGDEIFARTVTVNGLSKSHAMTGWRIGYAAGPSAIIDAIKKLQSHCTSGPTTFCQLASIGALQDKSDLLEQNRMIFQKRRDLIFEGISAINGISCCLPGGAFYLFPDVSAFYGKELSGKIINNSLDFCAHLLETQHVAAVPGIAFDDDNCIRLSYATSDDQINEAVQRIERFIKGD